jgi:hypothetical protein
MIIITVQTEQIDVLQYLNDSENIDYRLALLPESYLCKSLVVFIG